MQWLQSNGSGFLGTNSQRNMELTDNITFNEIIENYLKEFDTNMSIKDVVYKVVKDNLINKKALRNKCILQDFDILLRHNNSTMRNIYDDLAYKYNLSLRQIQDIIVHK